MARTVVLKNFDYTTLTDKGRIRERNEDALSYYDTINGHAFVVCDGMGGHNAGDVAAELAVGAVKEFLNEKYCSNPFEAIENCINYANRKVYHHAKGNDYLEGMGTTIVLILIRDDRVYYGHAGDSRLYLYRNQVLDQMTEDHSVIQQMMKAGVLTFKEALEHPRRHEITRALGLISDFEPDVSPRAIIPQNDDYLLLCSDGLTNLIEANEIIKILDNPFSLKDKAGRLVSRANRKGGTDNISVILIRFHNIGDKDEQQDEVTQKSIIGSIRNLLRTRKFSFLLIMLFFVGTFFIITKKEDEKLDFLKHEFTHFPMIRSDELIIPYNIKDGETIKNVADKFNTDVETINQLNPNYALNQQGVHLKIPVKVLYIVKNGDDLELIADKYGIDLICLMKANELSSLKLKIGKELIIPYKKK